MDADRAFYVGLLGKPSWRELGAYTVYVSRGRPFLLRYMDGAWQKHGVAAVRPYVPHQIASPDKSIAVVLTEPESVDLSLLPCRQEGMRRSNGLPILASRVRTSGTGSSEGASSDELFGPALEEALYGGSLGRKLLDPRIAHIVERIRSQPEARYGAEECAREVNLSFSRFLHLFKSETGTPFRRFQAWKRARGVLPQLVKGGSNLTEVALDAGYPDSTHFSHSIKHIYGLRPSDILSGSRRLELIDH